MPRSTRAVRSRRGTLAPRTRHLWMRHACLLLTHVILLMFRSLLAWCSVRSGWSRTRSLGRAKIMHNLHNVKNIFFVTTPNGKNTFVRFAATSKNCCMLHKWSAPGPGDPQSASRRPLLSLRWNRSLHSLSGDCSSNVGPPGPGGPELTIEDPLPALVAQGPGRPTVNIPVARRLVANA
jgi:hypothetical protein